MINSDKWHHKEKLSAHEKLEFCLKEQMDIDGQPPPSSKLIFKARKFMGKIR